MRGRAGTAAEGEGFPSRATLELIFHPGARLRSDRHCSHPSTGKTAWPWLMFPSDILGGGLLFPIFPARSSLFLLCSSPCVRNREETGMPARNPDFFPWVLLAVCSASFPPKSCLLPQQSLLAHQGTRQLAASTANSRTCFPSILQARPC